MSDKNKSESDSQLYRRTLLGSTAAAAAVGMIGSAAANTPQESPLNESVDRDIDTASHSTTDLDDPPTVLLIRDCVIWDTTANEDVLQQLGFEYDVISSQTAIDQLPEYDQLDEIDVVLIPSTQSTEYYENISSIWETITGFVENGGVLVVHASESGWPCFHDAQQEGSKLPLPRGVNNEYTYLPERGGEEVETLQELTVSADDHPIAQGWDNESLSYWSRTISTFGYYSDVPADATSIFGFQVNPEAHPTFLEYPVGQGVVVTTMQVVEWPFGEQTDGSDRRGSEELLVDEITYAVETATDITAPPEEGRVRGTVTITDTDGATVDATAYLIDPVRESAVQDYIDGTGELPETKDVASVEDGEFIFDEVAAGDRLVLVDPDETFDPEYEVVAVPTEQTTDLSFELDADVYLGGLDSEFDDIEAAAENIIANSTEDIAHVHAEGAREFDQRLDKKDYLNMALTSVKFAMGLSPDLSNAQATAVIGDFLINTQGVVVEEHGYNQYLAGRVTDMESEEDRADLDEYVDQILDIEWLVDLEANRYQQGVETLQVFLSNTDVHSTAIDQIEDKRELYETDIVRQQPHEDFDLGETKRALRVQARWLADNGLAPGVVVTPTGSSYVTRRTDYHRNHFEAVHEELQTTERLKTVSSTVSVAGAGITKAGVGSVAVGGVGIPVAVIGSVAKIGGAIGSYAFRAHSMNLQNQLADAYADTLVYWVDDLKTTPEVLDDILGWLEAEIQNPTLSDTDGSIESTDLGGRSPPLSDTTYALANRPDYPRWWVLSPRATPQHRRVGTNTVEVKNTGRETAEFTLTTVDTYGDGNTNGVSDAVSVRPNDNDPNDTFNPVLQPEDSMEVDIEYSSNFHWNAPFNWHTMTTVLWMNGKPVDDSEDPYYIVPSMDVIPFSAQEGDSLDVEAALADAETDVEIETQSYRLTDASKGPKEALTVDDWTENVGDIVEIVDETVSTEQTTAGTQFEVGPELQGVVFVLAAPPDAELNMHVYDEAGRHVGYEPEDDTDVVEIPGAEYNGSESTKEIVILDDAAGSYGVEVKATRFNTDDAVSVSAYAIEIPQREAIVGISPTVAGTVLEPGDTETVEVELSETGEQVGVEITDISLEPFQTENGDPLEDAAVLLSETPDEIAAGGTGHVELTFDAAPSLSVPDGESDRVWSELTIETANAGTTVVDVTVLAFETDEDARLVESGTGVESVSIDAVSIDDVPEPPEEELVVTDAYEVDVTGEDIAVVSFPSEFVEDKLTSAYQVTDNEWTNLDTSAGERVAVEVEAPTEEMLVITQEDIGSPVDGVTQEQFDAVLPNGADTTLGELRNSVADWADGNEIDGVELTLGELRAIVDWWSTQ